MKRYITFLIILLAGIKPAVAVGPDAERKEDFSGFFLKAAIMDSTLILEGRQEFAAADRSRKDEIIRYMLDVSKTRRAVVDTEEQSWIWFMYDGRLYCSGWNTGKNLIDDYSYARVDRLGNDKWFFSAGGEISISSSVSVGINGRIGTYLWNRFLDAGLGLNVGYDGGGEGDVWNVAVDLTSRVYFTRFFSKWPLSPFMGVGLGYVFCPDMNLDPLATVGFDWYLSKGSIDLSVQYGKSSKLGITAGYTISF